MKTTQLVKFFLLVAHIAVVNATYPVATLYSDDGRSVTFSGRNSADLGAQNFDNVAVAAEVQGRWILYESYNYHGAFQIMTNTNNEGLNTEIRGKVSSIRLVGSSDDYTDSALTIYEGINFQGKEEYTATKKTLSRGASSIIISGNVPWTVFSDSNFDGDAVCVNPGMVYDSTDIGIPNNAI